MSRNDKGIGFFGGSFDPVHNGHLLVAEQTADYLGLECISFVLASQAPLKAEATETPAEHRLAMLRLALEGNPAFSVYDLELQRGGVSYTWETAEILREVYPDHTLYWIIGEDQVAQLDKWRRLDYLARMVEFACLGRPGHRAPLVPPIEGVRLHRVPTVQFDVSSTTIRERVRTRRSVRYLLPDAVIDYIQNHDLYPPI